MRDFNTAKANQTPLLWGVSHLEVLVSSHSPGQHTFQQVYVMPTSDGLSHAVTADKDLIETQESRVFLKDQERMQYPKINC